MKSFIVKIVNRVFFMSFKKISNFINAKGNVEAFCCNEIQLEFKKILLTKDADLVVKFFFEFEEYLTLTSNEKYKVAFFMYKKSLFSESKLLLTSLLCCGNENIERNSYYKLSQISVENKKWECALDYIDYLISNYSSETGHIALQANIFLELQLYDRLNALISGLSYNKEVLNKIYYSLGCYAYESGRHAESYEFLSYLDLGYKDVKSIICRIKKSDSKPVIYKSNTKKISFYGSCRIYEPLLILKKMNLFHMYPYPGKWFTHSLPEVVQKNQQLSGSKDYGYENFKCFTADYENSHDIYKDTLSPESLGFHSEKDVVVVEVSSIKELLIDDSGDDVYGQLSLYNNRKKLELDHKIHQSKITKHDRQALEYWLEKTIQEFEGKDILFIGFVEIGEKVVDKSRKLINNVLSNFCAERGIKFFNPTECVNKYGGYKEVMFNSTHYKSWFFPVIANEIYKKIGEESVLPFVELYTKINYSISRNRMVNEVWYKRLVDIAPKECLNATNFIVNKSRGFNEVNKYVNS